MENGIEKEHDFFSLVRFAFPTIIMMIVSGLYTIVDSVFVSNFVGTNGLSAMNIIFPVVNIMIGLAVMYSSGGNAIIANKLGKKLEIEAKKDFSFIVLITIISGVIITILGIFFIKPMIYMLGSNDLLYQYGHDYLYIILLFTVPYMLQLVFQTFYITDGRPELGLILTLIGGITNVILDYIFMAILKWGIKGAAIATGIGSLITSLYGLYYFLYKSETLRLTKPSWDLKVLLDSCSNGASEMITNLSIGVTTFLFNKILMLYIGEDGVAAVTIILYVQYLMITIYLGFSLGVSPIISYNYGANNINQLRNTYINCLKFIFASSLLMFVISYVFKNQLISVFIKPGNPVYDISENGFKIFAVSFLFAGLNIFTSTFFTSLANGKISGIISFLRTFVFIALGLYFFPKRFGVDGIWMAVPFAEIVTMLISVGFLQYGKKHYYYGYKIKELK